MAFRLGSHLAAGLVALAGCCAPAFADTVETLHVFKGTHHGGALPQGALLQASDGNLWGTTSQGGEGNDGIVFRMSLAGDYESVTGIPLWQGRNFVGDLVQTDDGTLWGVTNLGGDYDAGSILAIGLDGTVTLVYSFNPAGWGGFPSGGLLKASDGFLYGVVPDADSRPAAVYRLDPATRAWNVVATLPTECSYYSGHLIEGPDGAFYGLKPGQWGCAYRVTARGTAKVLHLWDKSRMPQSMVAAPDGYFYGDMTEWLHGGRGPSCPALFRMTTTGKATILRRFHCNGQGYAGGVVLGADGLLHGSTSHYDHGRNYATVWRAALDGSDFVETPVPNFAGEAVDTPMQASDGAVYASTSGGGRYGQGAIIRIAP